MDAANHIMKLFFRLIQKLKIRFGLRFDFDFFFGKGFTTWHKRPIRASDFPSISFESRGDLSVGIVLQGPVVLKRDFTIETLRLYRRRYPNVPIVLSTWKGLPQKLLAKCRDLNVFVLENEELDYSDFGNLSRQKVTSLAGLNELLSMKLNFALKTRTDQRIYSSDFIEQLLSLNAIFPRHDSKQRDSSSRIFITYQNSFIDRPLSGSDFLQFGKTADLARLWESQGQYNFSESLVAEQVLLGSYLASIGWPEESLFTEDSWNKAMGRIVGFIDFGSLDLFWFKYSSREFLWRRYGAEPLKEISPRIWYEAMLRWA